VTKPVQGWRTLLGNPLKVFLIALAGFTLVRMAEGLYSYANSSIADEFGVTQKALGVVISLSAVIGIFVSIICGTLADVIGRKRMFGVTILGSSIFIALQSLAPSLWLITILRGIAHGFLSALSPIKTTLVSEIAPARYRGILTGFLQAGSPLGTAIAGFVAVLVIDQFGWRWGFVSALLLIPPGLALWWMLGENGRLSTQAASQVGSDAAVPSSKTAKIWQQITEFYGGRYRRNAIICTAAAFLVGGSLASSVFFWKPYFETTKGLTPVQASTVIAIGYWISVCGFLLSAVVGEFLLSRRDTFITGMCVGAVALLSLVWWANGFYPILVCYSLTTFFTLGVLSVFGTLINESFPAHIRATASTMAASSGLDAGFIVFPIITTTVAVDWWGWNSMFSVFVAMPLLLAAFLFSRLPRVKSGLELDEVVNSMHGL